MTVYIVLLYNGYPYTDSIVAVFDTLDKAEVYIANSEFSEDLHILEWDVG